MAKKKRAHDTEAFAGGAFGAVAPSVEAEAAASDAARGGWESFRNKAGKIANMMDDMRRGFLFERIESAKYNTDAARKGAPKFHLNDAEGSPHDPVDGYFEGKRGSKEDPVQFKSSKNEESASNEVRKHNEKYPDNKTRKVVHKDQSKKVEESTGDKNVIEGLEKDGAGSGGTSFSEAKFATDNPKFYSFFKEGSQVVREAGVAGMHAAAGAGLMGGAISAGRNLYAYFRGEIEGKEAAENIAADTGKAGVRGGLTGTTGTVIRHGAAKAGLPTLAKANVATAVAALVVETEVIVLDYAKGEISAGEAAERIGSSGCSTLASIYTGAAAGAVFGPAGAVGGSIAGYMVTTSVYQSCIAIMRNARLAEEEAARVVALCEQAVRSLDQQRESFESALNEHLNERQARFDGFFKEIDEALDANRTDDAVSALSGLVASCGRELQLEDFEEFDRRNRSAGNPVKESGSCGW